MFIFYVDESGSPESHLEPLLNGQTPLCVLASLAFHADKWRSIDRSYLDLKRKFFSKEIGNKRPEQYEVKGTDLVGPHNRASRRRHAFVQRVMHLCSENGAVAFAVLFKKNPVNPISRKSMYTMGLQYLVERFNTFLEETSEGITPGIEQQHAQGIILADTRMRNLDLNVAISHLSFIFGHPIGQRCQRVIEAPTFTFSELSVGVQLTDIFASYAYANWYRKNCRSVPGALDYSHMVYFETFSEQLQYRSQSAYDGYYIRGYRFIDHSVPP